MAKQSGVAQSEGAGAQPWAGHFRGVGGASGV